MIEQIFKLADSNGSKVVEMVINDENIHYNHMILPSGEGLPVHKTNPTIYMTVVRGTLTITLNEQESNVYEKGTILKIPKGITMHARNEHGDILELLVVKAPAPTAHI